VECPKCQHENPEGAKFCNGCGFDLASSQPSGERRQATIVFSDLSGYTAMNERLDPEAVQALMSRIKAEAVRIVESHGGIVNQFVGDEVVALFGIPAAYEDDPARAVRASLELHEFVRAMGTEVADQIGQPLTMHTGINTGLIVTHLEDDRDGRYGLTGDTVNTGARLLAQAETDTILVSPETHNLIAPYFDTEALPPVTMKGKAGPMIPYRIIGEAKIKTRIEAAEQRGFTQFTGRQSELATLDSCLENAIVGDGQFISIVGEAGVGKSRLLHEFQKALNSNQITLLQGRCSSYGANTPYLPFLELLRKSAEIRNYDTSAQTLARIRAHLEAVDPKLAEKLPLILHLLSIHSDDHPLPTGLEGEALGRALRGAISGYTIQQSDRQPTVLILEDWHWVDEASAEALKELVNIVPSHRLLVVVLYRPEHDPDWGETEHHTQIDLKPLEAAATVTIIQSGLGADELPDGLADSIHERTGGNPFFIEEVCRSLVESGAVEVNSGNAVLTVPLEQINLPRTVQAVVQSRLDRLDREVQEAVRLASVIGREFAQALLERIHSAQAGLDYSLNHLQLLAIIYQTNAEPDAAYIFKHVITQQVAYETLLLKRRKELHALVGQAIENLYVDRLEEHHEELAHHYRYSDDVDKAVHYLILAGSKARNRLFALDIDAEYKLAAYQILQAAPETPERKSKFAEVSLEVVRTRYSFWSEENIAMTERAVQIAQELQDASLEYDASMILADMMGRKDVTIADSLLERCLHLAEVMGDEYKKAETLFDIGFGDYTGDIFRAIAKAEEGVALMRRLGEENRAVRMQGVLGWGRYSELGKFKEAVNAVEAALEFAKVQEDRLDEMFWWARLGMVYTPMGDWPACINSYSEARRIAEEGDAPGLLAVFNNEIGNALSYSGELESGLEMMIQANQSALANESSLAPYEVGKTHFKLATVYALLGNVTESTQHVEAGHLLSKRLEMPPYPDGFIKALWAAWEEPPDWKRIDEHLHKTIGPDKPTRNRPELALSHFRGAEFLHKKGDLEAAREQLDQAVALFSDMEMTWWSNQAEKLRGRIEAAEPWRGFAPYLDGEYIG